MANLNDLPQLPFNVSPSGVDMGTVMVIPSGANVIYVRSTGPSDYDPPSLTGRIVPTLNAALAYCRSGKGDIVSVLSNHTESITGADFMNNLVAGTRILGQGAGSARPTFTWTAAGSTFLFDVANTVIENCILNFDPGSGTVNVAAPITVSATGCAIRRCFIRAGTDANSKITIGVTTNSAATNFKFESNEVKGAALATMTTFLRLVAATNCEIASNNIACGTTAAAVGPIQALTTLSADVNIHNNYLHNNAASSTACITGMTGLTGTIADNRCRNMLDGSVAWIATPGDTQLFQNFGVNNSGETGILIGTPSV